MASMNTPAAQLIHALIVVVLTMVMVACLVNIRRTWRRLNDYAITRAVPLRSRLDGMNYRVNLSHPAPEKAAETLAELNRRFIVLFRRLRKLYGGAAANNGSAVVAVSGAMPLRRASTARLLKHYSPDALAENSPFDPEGETSFTEDKGLLVGMCLRSTDAANPIQDINTLMFVGIHEISHIAVIEIDHPPLFWQAFRFLLEEAVNAGVYTPIDYKHSPVMYCGRLNINHSPLFDDTIGEYV
jgi:hypothetical protein